MSSRLFERLLIWQKKEVKLMPEHEEPHFPKSLQQYDPENRKADRGALEDRIRKAVLESLSYDYCAGVGDWTEMYEHALEEAFIEAGLRPRVDD